ncbi:TetR/AcrR family transcriptional regulator [Nocardioides immobilis]|uniref:TetR/AcrR family transcriptional regulator n=2 Tax=Nocardioides immobilis TaxID=2049295 RepID=A0A417Y4M2_9ACTN|nr:TetR/AcrR family transcriptional regulator [Nocardioides immobilis]
MPARQPLNPARIITAAAAVADRSGLAAVSMRSVGKELGVEAMSLYHHIPGKEALLDGLADWVFAQVELPGPDDPWREAMASRAGSARAVLARHSWALGMIESRSAAGPQLLRHHDTVLGTLLAAGFPMALAVHAFSVIDAYVYGFVLTEVNLPFEPTDGAAEAFAAEMAPPPDEYPHLSRMLTELVLGREYVFADEFGYGLELILDGLERRLHGGSPSPPIVGA